MRAVLALLVLAYAAVDRDHRIEFPRDEGSHPAFRTEWWYATGWLETRPEVPLGFQITFFRSRPFAELENPSAFAPEQIIFAHAAIADPDEGKLLHEQRSARTALALAGAKEGEMDVWIRDWTFRRDGDSYVASIRAEQFSFELRLEPTQPALLQGDRGFSRKGKDPASASHYYSLPQLSVTGRLTRAGDAEAVTGTAWLDHEWSSTLLEAPAVGWDWTGINLDDGGALMLFQIRRADGTEHWAGGSLRDAAGSIRRFHPDEIEFVPLQRWRSPRSGTTYPIEWRIRAGEVEWTLTPLMNDQELDSRSSTGAIYWEGAVIAHREGKLAGKGYLELTGYHKPLRLN
jgi:predicted secreted hydrolase